MKPAAQTRTPFPLKVVPVLLASALALPALAQQAQPQNQDQQAQPQAQQPMDHPPSAPSASGQELTPPAKEGFWGHMNPFARKKWVNKRVDPLRDRVNELDEVSAKNARDIKDVDSRAQVGISKAQSTADSAGQAASAANSKAQMAGNTAQQAADHVNSLNTTVSGLDQYRSVNALEIHFKSAQPVLSDDAKKQLDDLASGLTGHKGYILEIEGHSPGAGAVGVQSSARFADAVKRYLVLEHQIPVYRLHEVALGNAAASDQAGSMNMADNAKPAAGTKAARTPRTVQVRLMENSLAAQGAAPPHRADSLNGAERP